MSDGGLEFTCARANIPEFCFSTKEFAKLFDNCGPRAGVIGSAGKVMLPERTSLIMFD